jgi:hypothetical protein
VAPSTTLEAGRVSPDKLRGVTVSTADWTEVPEEPVIVALVTAVTGDVDTVNAAVVAPAATTTLGGTVAETLLLDSVTSSPPAGAAPFKVTVPAAVPPPGTLAGLSATVATPGDDTVRTVDCEAPAYIAVMVAVMSTPTASVVTVKDALVPPVGTVTLTGSGTDDGWVVVRSTATPGALAAPLSVTVPVVEPPPTSDDGLMVIDETASGPTVSTALAVDVPTPAVMVTLTEVGVVDVVIGKVAVVAPDGTVTLAGTAAMAASLVESWTVAPWAGAAAASVTVPCSDAPPMTLAGLRTRLDTVTGTTVRVAVRVPLANVADRVTVVELLTRPVAIANDTVVEPPATVTLAGTAAARASLLESETVVPPAGAADAKETVPVAFSPAVTVSGFTTSDSAMTPG